MTYGTRTDHYPGTSKLLHWLVALCVLATAPVAISMTRIAEGPTRDMLYNFHKSLGVTILVLMILRLINRLAVGAPIADPGIEPWQKAVSSSRICGTRTTRRRRHHHGHGCLRAGSVALCTVGRSKPARNRASHQP
jgi:hypothetical protein